MEGKATLTLSDAKTGRVVREMEEHNLVTDAVRRILDPPLYTAMYGLKYDSFVRNVMPVSKLFSGVMLLGNTLTESRDNVMPDGSIIPIATAGGEYVGTNVRRGTLNTNETYATENGYHFTWDFGTDKANGVIKSIALTSHFMGDSAFGSTSSSGKLYANPSDIENTTSINIRYCYARGQYIGTFQDRLHLYIKSTGNTVTFLKYRSLDPHSIKVNDTVAQSAFYKAEFSCDVELPITLYYWYKAFLDPVSRVLYFFGQIHRDSSSNLVIDYAGVDLNTYKVVSTGTQTVDPSNTNLHACAVYKGRFYMTTDNNVQIYTLGGGLLKMHKYYIHSSTWFSAVDGMLYVQLTSEMAGMLTDNNEMYTFYNPTWNLPAYSCDVKPPYYPMYYFVNKNNDEENTSRNPSLGLALNYFATINNLNTPLEKTSEHNLKITYDITN